MMSDSTKMFDITLLTDARYVQPKPGDWYVENIHLEDQLLREALEALGLRVQRKHWDDPAADWSQTRFAMFRTTWDYFERFPEFDAWLNATSRLTQFINPLPLIRWNMDKHYLLDLAEKGIAIPPSLFIERGSTLSLRRIAEGSGWDSFVLKPAISGAARHTYRLDWRNIDAHEAIFQALIASESMLLQAFLHNVPRRGEITLMIMNGRYTHAVLKRAKAGDFRVQDDFGGSVHDYRPTVEEIAFAERVVAACPSPPLYARVDMVWDNEDQLCVSELEAIEPELWMRKQPVSAQILAEGIATYLQQH